MTPRLCRVCNDRQAMPSRIRRRDYRCSRCIHQSAHGQARLARYNAGAARRRAQARSNAKRIFVGNTYHSQAATAEQAKRINAHVKERQREFISRFADREEAQGAPAR